jgi:DNA-binding NarL/FixJ family response regulator
VTRTAHVSPAQHRVLVNLLTDGPDNAEIAARLHVTEGTVRSHMTALRRAFDVTTKAGIVCAFYRGTVKVCVIGEEW